MGRRIGLLSVLGALLLVAIIVGLAGFRSLSPQPQTLYVVRNGGPLDNKRIRSVIKPGSGWTYLGFFSTSHGYPDSTQQRFYTITSNASAGDRSGVDVVSVPTRDGVNVGLEGTFYFTTSFDASTAGIQSVRNFDEQYGIRTFRAGGTTSAYAPWQGNAGWSAYLDAVVRPVIDNELRVAIGSLNCSELVASCALTQSASADTSTAGAANQTNIATIQPDINKGLASDLDQTQGHRYFSAIQFRLNRVTLPAKIQTAVDDVQAARVEVARASARVDQAKKQNEANALLAKVYDASPAIAQIDMIKALPAGTNVYFGVSPVTAVGAASAVPATTTPTAKP